MEHQHSNSAQQPYDPYAPEIVRKMAVVALVCAIAAFALATFCGVAGFSSHEDYSQAIRNGEVIYTHWLHRWLLDNFGPLGVLFFHETSAILFLALGVFAAREWRVMRRGQYDPERDKAPVGLPLHIAIVCAAGVLAFFAIVKVSVALGL